MAKFEPSPVMKPLTGLPKRSKFAVIDIESKDGDTQNGGFTRPFLVGYYDGDKYLAFSGPNCVSNCISYILDAKLNGMTYYAHNGGSFDWLHFLPEIAKANFSFEILTVSSSIQVLRVLPSDKSKKKGWTFLDSLKLFPTKLEAFAKAMAVETLKQVGFDYNTPEEHPSWEIYNKADCVSLYQSISKFHDLVESIGGEVGVTTASTAMRTFRRSYQEKDIFRHKKYHDLFRACYYGGRVEPVRDYGEDLAYYDVNSSYPFAMLQPMPIGRAVKVNGRPSNEIREKFPAGFVRARVKVPTSLFIPVLPFRHDNRLTFPTGEFEGSWTSLELDAAEKRGCEVEYLDGVWIETEPVFEKYVRQLFKYRDKSLPNFDEGLSQTAKILLNSLYGKFGMNTERDKVFFISPDNIDALPDKSTPANPHDPDCGVWYYTEEVDAPYIIPQIAAWITSIARLTLLNIIELAESRGKVYYYDTDSVITDADLSDLCSKELGGFKDEGDGIRYTGTFIQPKLYSLIATSKNGVPIEPNEKLNKIVMKGYKNRSLKEFEAIRNKGVVTYETLEKIGSMARAGFKRGPMMRLITRQIQTQEKKRIHLPNGDTIPIHINIED